MAARTDSRELLPRGTVTMLFADLEGSTKLLDALGHRYTAVLSRQRDVVRTAVSAHEGTDIDWAGDGVFAVFASARDAVTAAAVLQRELSRADWPNGTDVRLRIGVHTGEPQLTDEGYVGIDVHRAARICSAAHGGQIVVSEATRQLVGDEPLPGASFRPLGSYRLQDLPAPEPLFQLVGDGLIGEFPPLRSLTDSTLPALHHRLVGRDQELERIEALLRTSGVRLVTICGPGGAGKSRLALEVAARAAHERPVYLTGLASISDPEHVPAVIARAAGVRESSERTLLDGVTEHLAGSNALLVLDNLEHLPEAIPEIGKLLNASRDLSVLATSRSRLNLAGERVVALDPLLADDAMTFFAELADARGAELPAGSEEIVRTICRRLDGLPLAIELVAARLPVLPPAALLRALDEGLALSTEGPVDMPQRHRTLRATIEWSYGLLTDRQRGLHSALAVFAGGCNLQDGLAVGSTGEGDGMLADVEALVRGSLLRSDADTDGEPRLAMLDTVREYGLQCLSLEGRLEETRDRHAQNFLALARNAEEHLAGPDQAAWLTRLEREHDNLRAACDWCLERNRVEEVLQAVSALGRFWRAHGHVGEARSWLKAGLESDVRISETVRADALWTSARQAAAQNDFAAADPALREALGLFEKLGRSREAVFALAELALSAQQHGASEEAQRHAERALSIARRGDDQRALSAALNRVADIASDRRDYAHARTSHEEALAIRRQLGDPLLVANSALNAGMAALRANDLEHATTILEECLALARHVGDGFHTAFALCALGEVALAREETTTATALLVESYRMSRELGDERTQAECLHALAGVAAASGGSPEAARLFGSAESMRQRVGTALMPEEEMVIERYVGRIQDELGPDAYDRERVSGQRSHPDDLVRYMAKRLGVAITHQ